LKNEYSKYKDKMEPDKTAKSTTVGNITVVGSVIIGKIDEPHDHPGIIVNPQTVKDGNMICCRPATKAKIED